MPLQSMLRNGSCELRPVARKAKATHTRRCGTADPNEDASLEHGKSSLHTRASKSPADTIFNRRLLSAEALAPVSSSGLDQLLQMAVRQASA